MKKGYDYLKDEIKELYENQYCSKSEISRVLGIDRKCIARMINEWGFTQEKYTKGIYTKTQSFLDENKDKLIEMLNNDVSLSEIARTLGVDRGMITRTCTRRDNDIKSAYDAYHSRRNSSSKSNREEKMSNSQRQYDYEDIEGEVWADINDFPGYQVSNMGRVRRYAKRYKAYYLIKPEINKETGRYYVSTYNEFGRKSWILARLVAIYHVPGYSEFLNLTVNHENGDVSHNEASNLTWMTQKENNQHAHRVLERKPISAPNSVPHGFLYQGRYFHTIAELVFLIDKSRTQVARYIADPEKYGITIIK